MTTHSVAVVLPARYHSSRFPGKPLAVVAGKPLIEWVYRRASEIQGVSRVVVATDHEHIASAVKSFGGAVVMTSGDHATGTDRVAEVATALDDELIVNLQGDEPVFPPALVEEMISVFAGDSSLDIVTAAHRITDAGEIENPNVVKVVMDRHGKALYFSRSVIPSMKAAHDNISDTAYYRHVGIYVFKKESLLRIAGQAPTPLEQSERLEQLRALENGMSIHVVKTEHTTVGVDVPDDIKSVEKALSAA
jgi:3-deoxy-manno-octulosonate cytidylyltransferase (CMP-KDO synthetase)